MNIIRTEEELWKKYEEQKEICGTDEGSKNPFDDLVTVKLRRIGLTLLEWVLGLKGEPPTEEDVHAEYIQEIETHPRPQRGLMRGFPMQERSVKTAWLGWILGIPDDEIKTHQKQYEVK